ncbi:hypothetical protein DFQ26_006572 [Actinomortierella ambigua]|nr:hypothetical protein DFQ26_006572 [Actinomortierella ambigua]
MAFSEDLRLRAVILYSFHGLSKDYAATILGVSVASVTKWTERFNKTGSVMTGSRRVTTPRWPDYVLAFLWEYVKHHSCFLLEELQEEVRGRFPEVSNISLSTICRALRHDLRLSRKKLTKLAREAVPKEVEDYKFRLSLWYRYPEQLLFIDETSKDGRAAIRTHAWSLIGSPAFVLSSGPPSSTASSPALALTKKHCYHGQRSCAHA